MRDLLESLDRIIEAPRTEKGGGDASNIQAKPKPEDPRTVTNKKFGSIGDFIKAIRTPGQQGGSTAAQTRANLAKATAPKIDPNVPAGGPLRADPVDPQQAAVAKAASAVVNAPKNMAMPKSPPRRAKVKATAANTKDFEKTMALQKRLQAQGADIKADGIMGPNTRAAMKKFGGGKPATAVQTGGSAGEFSQGQQSIANIRAKVRQDKAAQAAASAERPGILSRIAGIFKPERTSRPGGRNRRRNRATALAQATPAQTGGAGGEFGSSTMMSRRADPEQRRKDATTATV